MKLPLINTRITRLKTARVERKSLARAGKCRQGCARHTAASKPASENEQTGLKKSPEQHSSHKNANIL